jgi:hypothetical protein
MSKLYKGNVKTSDVHYQEVILTAQRNGNDINGNSKYKVQVWMIVKDDHNMESGTLWSPVVKGYRKNKYDEYTLVSSDLDHDVTRFIEAFEKTVRA